MQTWNLPPHPSRQRGRIGIFACGHNLYWPQFPALQEKLAGHYARFTEHLQAELEADIVSIPGICDNPEAACAAGHRLSREDVDAVFCYIATYTPSANVLPVAQITRRPLVLLSLQPSPALDYTAATTELQLENDCITSVPEIAGVLRRAGLPAADIIVGTLDKDDRAAQRTAAWAGSASALRALRTSRIGLLGHVYEGMLDMNFDPTAFDAAFGLHTVHLETSELKARVQGVSAADIKARQAEIRRLFHFPEPGSDPIAGLVSDEMLEIAARTSAGLESLIDDFHLNGLAYYFHGRGDETYEDMAGSLVVGNSLLTARGVPVAGEYDLKTCIAMLIMDRLGMGGSFAELHPVDFDNDFVLVGHDGPHHIAIAEGKPVLRGLSIFHGKTGRGPSVEFQIKTGPITVLGVTLGADGRIRLVAAEGESLPGPIPATGNTNTRGRFKPDVRTFLERWSAAGTTHHFALGTGSRARDIEKLAEVLGLEYICIA